MSLIPNAKALDAGWVAPKGIFTSTGATVVAWSTKAFPEGAGPKSWKDFWDVKTFPGPRGLYKPFYYNYEAALLAAGMPHDDVYPVTDDKVKLAMDKIRELKPNVKCGGLPARSRRSSLSSGELAMSSAWSGRVLAIMKENAPVAMTYEDGIAWGNAWVVPKGAPNAKLAMEAINYAISPEAQARLLDFGPTARCSAMRRRRERPSSASSWSRRRKTSRTCSSSTRSRRRPIRRNTKTTGIACSSNSRALMTSPISGQRLAPLLAPRSIAFVGASARPNTPGNDMMRMIRRGGLTGSSMR